MNDIVGTQLHFVEAARTSGFAASSSSEIQPADVSTADVARKEGAADQTGENASTVSSSTMAVVRAFIYHVTTTCLQDFPPTYFMWGMMEERVEWLVTLRRRTAPNVRGWCRSLARVCSVDCWLVSNDFGGL